MADDFDTEAPDVMENDIFRQNVPDFTVVVIKKEILNYYDSEFESTTSSVQDRKPVFEEEIGETYFDTHSSEISDNENLQNNIVNCNKIILGSKANIVYDDDEQENEVVFGNAPEHNPNAIDEKMFENLVTCYEPKVELHDIQSYLHKSRRFCITCGILFPEPNTFERHVHIFHTEKISHQSSDLAKPRVYKCTICVKQFFTPHVLRRHLSNIHRLKNGNDMFRKRHKYRSVIDTTMRQHKCKICGKKFVAAQVLRTHLIRIHKLNNEKVPKQQNCHIITNTPEEINSPTVSHDNTLGYHDNVCFHCKQTFDTQKSLIEHLYDILQMKRKNTEIVPVLQSILFKCNKCDIHFTSSQFAANHTEHMEMLINWKCAICNRIFKNEDALSHERQHTVANNFLVFNLEDFDVTKFLFKCSKCDIHFNESNFLYHFRDCGLEVPKSIKCEICNLFLDYNLKTLHEHSDPKPYTIIECDVLSDNPVKAMVNEYPAKEKLKELLKSFGEVKVVLQRIDSSKLYNMYKFNTVQSSSSRKCSNTTENDSTRLTTTRNYKNRDLRQRRNMTYYFCETCKCFVTRHKKKVHLQGRCKKIAKKICKVCGLMFTAASLLTHSQLHKVKKNLSLNHLKFYNLYNGQPINPALSDIVNITRPPNIHKLLGRRNLTYLYCETCECFLTKFSNFTVHKRKLCNKLKKITCKNCGLRFTSASMVTHTRLHEERKDLSINDFKLFNLNNGKPMTPPVPEIRTINEYGNSKVEYKNIKRFKNIDLHNRRNLSYYYCETCKCCVSIRKPVHLKALCRNLTKSSCNQCGLTFTNLSMTTHMRLHVKGDFSLNDIEFFNLHTGQPINPPTTKVINIPQPLNNEAEDEHKEQYENMDGCHKSRNLSYYYCETCKCCVRIKKPVHLEARCRDLAKSSCNQCGLTFTNLSMTTHMRLHMKGDFSLNDIEFFNVHTGQPINPPSTKVINKPQPLNIEVVDEHIAQSEIMDGCQKRRNQSYYYCETCKCCVSIRKNVHLEARCRDLAKSSCNQCGLTFTNLSMTTHMRLHEERDLSLNDIEFYNLYSGQPINPPATEEINIPQPVNNEAEDEHIEQSENMDGCHSRRNLSYYYCETCKCCVTARKTIHLEARCKDLAKSSCNQCGLTFTNLSMTTHTRLHEEGDFSLTYIEFFDLNSAQPINPPAIKVINILQPVNNEVEDEHIEQSENMDGCQKRRNQSYYYCETCKCCVSIRKNVHLEARCMDLPKSSCNQCGLTFTNLSMATHMRLHEERDLSLNDIEFYNLYSGQPINPPATEEINIPQPVNNEAEDEHIEQSENMDGCHSTRNLSYYYCETCKCCVTARKTIHLEARCKDLAKSSCNQCGLTFTNLSMTTHMRLHEDGDFSLNDIEFYNLYSGQPINPPATEEINTPQPVNNEAEVEHIEQSENMDGCNNRCNVSYYYCETCKCCVNIRNNIHLEARCGDLAKSSCSQCGLTFTNLSMATHMRLHEEGDLSLNDIEFFDLYSERPINPPAIKVINIPQPVNNEVENEHIEQSENMEGCHNRRNLSYYYCETCTSCVSIRNNIHLEARCRDLAKSSCNQCGLTFTNLSIATHMRLHDEGDLSLNDIEFFDLYSERPINPPVIKVINIPQHVNNEVEDEHIEQSENMDGCYNRRNLSYYYCETCTCCVSIRNNIHLEARCRDLAKSSCNQCGLTFTNLSMPTHMRLHEEGDLSLNDIQFYNLHSGEPINPPTTEEINTPQLVNNEAEDVHVEQSENMDGWHNMRNLSYYYCETCKCCVSIRKPVHLEARCQKLDKSSCKLCGLTFTKQSMMTHMQLHEKEDLTFNNYKFFDLCSGLPINPLDTGVLKILIKKQNVNNEEWRTRRNLTYYFCETCKCFVTKFRKKAHLEARCKNLSKDACKLCNLMFTTASLMTHKKLHDENKDLSLNNFKFFNLYNGQPINLATPEVVNVKRILNTRKHHGRRNLTYYYCETCMCFLTKFNNAKIHKRKFCKRMAKMLCKYCGLMFTSASMMTHKRLHEERKDLTLKNFKFFNLNNGQPINPPELQHINESTNKEALVKNIKSDKKVDEWLIKRNFTYYYCETCKCFITMFRKVTHLKGRCKKLAKTACKRCGLMFTNGSIMKHLLLHKENNELSLKDFKFFNLYNGQPMNPPSIHETANTPLDIEAEDIIKKRPVNMESKVECILRPLNNEDEFQNCNRPVNTKPEVINEKLPLNFEDRNMYEIQAVNVDGKIENVIRAVNIKGQPENSLQPINNETEIERVKGPESDEVWVFNINKRVSVTVDVENLKHFVNETSPANISPEVEDIIRAVHSEDQAGNGIQPTNMGTEVEGINGPVIDEVWVSNIKKSVSNTADLETLHRFVSGTLRVNTDAEVKNTIRVPNSAGDAENVIEPINIETEVAGNIGLVKGEFWVSNINKPVSIVAENESIKRLTKTPVNIEAEVETIAQVENYDGQAEKVQTEIEQPVKDEAWVANIKKRVIIAAENKNIKQQHFNNEAEVNNLKRNINVEDAVREVYVVYKDNQVKNSDTLIHSEAKSANMELLSYIKTPLNNKGVNESTIEDEDENSIEHVNSERTVIKIKQSSNFEVCCSKVIPVYYYCETCKCCITKFKKNTHLQARCKNLVTTTCQYCGLMFTGGSMMTHTRLHEKNKDLTLDNFKFFNLYNGQPMNTPIPELSCINESVNVTQPSNNEFVNIKDTTNVQDEVVNINRRAKREARVININQTLNIAHQLPRRKLIYYFCDTCKCYIPNFNQDVHLQARCKKIPKKHCKYCGLKFTKASLMTHKRLHENNKNLTLNKFKFFNLYNGRPMSTPITKLNLKDKAVNATQRSNNKTVNIKETTNVESEAVNINQGTKREARVINTNRTFNVTDQLPRRNLIYYFCDTCKCYITNFRKDVHLQARCKNFPKKRCKFCGLKFTKSSMMTHKRLHENNKSLTLNNFKFFNLYNGRPMNTPLTKLNIQDKALNATQRSNNKTVNIKETTNVESEVVNINQGTKREAKVINLKQTLNVADLLPRHNLIYYFCDTCKCYIPNLKKNVHLQARCKNFPKKRCKHCGLKFTIKTMNTHSRLHEKYKDFSLKNFKIFNLYDGQPINTPTSELINCRRITEECNLTNYYCNTCKCFVTHNKKADHVQSKCISLSKINCKYCGLILTSTSFAIHKSLHDERKDLTLKDFKFFDLNNGQPISPPIPEYPKCPHCAVHFLTITAKNSHICSDVSCLTCHICDIKLSEAAFKLHMAYHQYKTDDTNTIESNKLQSVYNLNYNAEKDDTEKSVVNTTNTYKSNETDFCNSVAESPLKTPSDVCSIVYSCQNCSTSVDTYDKAVEHSQRHYDIEEHVTQTEVCNFCNLKVDVSCYINHQNLHKKETQFKLLNFDSYYLPAENNSWIKHIFKTLSNENVVDILRNSIYRFECRIKMDVLQNGDPNLTVYKCDQCSCFIEPSSLFKHSENACFKIRSHPCTVCGIAFNSSSSRIDHEKIHNRPGLSKESYRIVVFNREQDSQINRSFYLRKNYVLYKCRSCDVIIDKLEDGSHKCDLTNVKNCPECDLLLNVKDYESHVNTHKKFVSFNYSNIKVVLLGQSLKERSENNLTSKFKGTIYDYKMFVCNKCEVCIKNEDFMPKHICRFGKQRLKCSKCALYFSVSRLKTHMRCHEQDPDFLRSNMYIISIDPCTLDQNKNATKLLSKDNDCELSDANSDSDLESSGDNNNACTGVNTNTLEETTETFEEETVNIYKCACELHFLNEDSIFRHFGTCKTNPKIIKLKCQKCDLQFTPNVLFTHLLAHHNNKGRRYKYNIISMDH